MTKTPKDNLHFFQQSPFFEVLDEKYLMRFAEHAKRVTFKAGTRIFKEGERAQKLYMLVDGEIKLSFEPRKRHRKVTSGEEALIRKISEMGRPIGWSAAVKPYKYRASAHATQESQMLIIESSFLRELCRVDPDFGIKMMKRILWVIGNRLRATRVRIVARRYDREVMAIRALLEQSVESLSVTSPLHKIPAYLENRLTIQDAFECLEVLKETGSEQERSIATLSLEILESVKKELALFLDQQAIYNNVASASPEISSEKIRDNCCQGFVKMFEKTNYHIQGLKRLPKKPGNIFIMNHLINHPDNLLPNDFQLTLDTHFVSSMIVYQNYGKAPVRVVRKSNPDEFRHKDYYDRLGYIYVYSKSLEEDGSLSKEERQELKEEFFNAAAASLAEGNNLVICPEGTSMPTEESPAPFKAGAFRLALSLDPEPFIVPIAVAHFDKKLTHTKTVALIQKPFKLSDKISRDSSDEELFSFVNAYRDTYKKYIREAIRLARQT